MATPLADRLVDRVSENLGLPVGTAEDEVSRVKVLEYLNRVYRYDIPNQISGWTTEGSLLVKIPPGVESLGDNHYVAKLTNIGTFGTTLVSGTLPDLPLGPSPLHTLFSQVGTSPLVSVTGIGPMVGDVINMYWTGGTGFDGSLRGTVNVSTGAYSITWPSVPSPDTIGVVANFTDPAHIDSVLEPTLGLRGSFKRVVNPLIVDDDPIWFTTDDRLFWSVYDRADLTEGRPAGALYHGGQIFWRPVPDATWTTHLYGTLYPQATFGTDAPNEPKLEPTQELAVIRGASWELALDLGEEDVAARMGQGFASSMNKVAARELGRAGRRRRPRRDF